MLVTDPYIFELRGEKSMGKDCLVSLDVDVEEGEISDSASVEEISAEDFATNSPRIPTDIAAKNDDSNHQRQPQQKVWTMQDLLKYQNKYQTSRNYAPGLYNFAWSQAVQNKPLDDYVTTINTSNTTDKRPSSNDIDNNNYNNSVVVSVNKEEAVNNNNIVIEVSGDDEKEEGELEEGEIDLDMEVIQSVKQEGEDNDNVEKQISVIRVGFESVTVNDAEKSYGGVCSKLENLLDGLSKVLLGNSILKKDDLVGPAFAAIKMVNSVYCSMSQNQKEQSRDFLSRVLTNVKSHRPPIFSPEQLKEVEMMLRSCNTNAAYSRAKDNKWDGNLLSNPTVNDHDSVYSAENAKNEVASLSEDCVLDAMYTGPSHQNGPQYSQSLKMEIPGSKNRVLLPLLDLHKDHDADSLPSPTRDTTLPLPLGKALFVGEAEIRPEWPAPRGLIGTQSSAAHHYETDAVKAVSTYQQKFGRNSFLMNDLPSPTPSEESCGTGGDCSGEVSSTSTVQNANSVTEPSPTVLTVPHVDRPNGQLLVNPRNAAYVNSTSDTRVPNRTRDPRLRLSHSEASSKDFNQCTLPISSNQPTMEVLAGVPGSRKQKTFDEPVLGDGPAPKRLKNDSTAFGYSKDITASSQSGGLLEDRVPVGMQVAKRTGNITSEVRGLENTVSNSGMPNTAVSGSVHIPVTGVNASSASLQSLLKDIAVNPSMWMNIINTEQQKSVDPAKKLTQSPSPNSILGSMIMTTAASTQPSVLGQKSTAALQMPQTASLDELGKLRMKSRDPRRARQSQASLQKPVSDQPTIISSVTSTKGNLKQADPKAVLSQPIAAPDIARLFTKNLKNIADIVSVSQTPASPAVPQMPSSQPAQVHLSSVTIKGGVSDLGHLQNGTELISEEVASCPSSQPQSNWGDVEHFFGRFDDQQKAAIQRERSRRMEEQEKMFADRKLCLVLDLDHTLLNSAKFVEVEPMHDEMLKKKEEQDRERPQRHLFRFPHMCMWTKLRPGIWNFLEKASKLYELHLYTMGNKLYATEMAKVLDPKGVLFNGRVISRGDDGDSVDGDPKSKDLEGVLGMESAVVIIDDSVRVWPHNKLNLIVVERYIYFPCSRRQFGLPGPSLLEIDHDERPEDGTLASSLAVIEKIHKNFFLQESLDEADVRNILASEQRKILGGCRIVFSRVFPVGEVKPHLHPLWQTAEQFGAVCTNQIDDQVTHVVANSLGTDKVNWALSTGRFVVHPGWVEASALLYRRANEHDFGVKP